MRSEMIHVPIDYAQGLLQLVEDSGQDIAPLLDELGITAEELSSSQQFSAMKYGQLYQRVMHLMQDEYFGMFSGGKVRLGSFRLLCLSVIQCTNLQQAVIRTGEFCEICRGMNIRFKLSVENDVARLRMCGVDALAPGEYEAIVDHAKPSQIRTQIAVSIRFYGWLIGQEIRLKTLYFQFPESESFKPIAELQADKTRFGQSFTGCDFSAAYLDYPIVQNQETLMDFLRTAPYHLVISETTHYSLKSKVRSILSRDVSVSMPSAEDVASRLNLSVTTLRRRLQGEGTSYQKLKDECRMEAAFHYLACPDLTNATIAERLGFDESSAFFRAFKKWTGVTPGEYRKQLS